MSNSAARIAPPVDEHDLSGVLVRTDYTDDDRFAKMLDEARRPTGAHSVGGANLLVVGDPRLAGIAPEQVIELVDVEDFALSRMHDQWSTALFWSWTCSRTPTPT